MTERMWSEQTGRVITRSTIEVELPQVLETSEEALFEELGAFWLAAEVAEAAAVTKATAATKRRDQARARRQLPEDQWRSQTQDASARRWITDEESQQEKSNRAERRRKRERGALEKQRPAWLVPKSYTALPKRAATWVLYDYLRPIICDAANKKLIDGTLKGANVAAVVELVLPYIPPFVAQQSPVVPAPVLGLAVLVLRIGLNEYCKDKLLATADNQPVAPDTVAAGPRRPRTKSAASTAPRRGQRGAKSQEH